MRFRIGDSELEADAEEFEPVISKHTGNPLRQLAIHFSVQGSDYNDFVLQVTDLAKKDGIESAEPDEDPTRWSVGNTNWSYRGEEGLSTYYHHNWELTEQEALNIDKL